MAGPISRRTRLEVEVEASKEIVHPFHRHSGVTASVNGVSYDLE